MDGDSLPKHVKSKKNKIRKVVYFDKEMITKDSAEKNLLNKPILDIYKSNNLPIGDDEKGENIDVDSSLPKSKSNLKRKKLKEKKGDVSKITKPNGDSAKGCDVNIKEHKPAKRRKENVDTSDVQGTEESEEDLEKDEGISLEKPDIKREESIRALKRKKHAKLLEEKRLKAEIASQQNALNYLSLWKHNRTEWKFEKLKQIWLQQNLFDSSKIPQEFWDLVVDYFCGAKGLIRNVILKNALGIIEKEEKSEEENTDEDHVLILKRARDIVQSLSD